jgi:hypothetical protein
MELAHSLAPPPPPMLGGPAVQMRGNPGNPDHCKKYHYSSFGLVVILILRSLTSDAHTTAYCRGGETTGAEDVERVCTKMKRLPGRQGRQSVPCVDRDRPGGKVRRGMLTGRGVLVAMTRPGVHQLGVGGC